MPEVTGATAWRRSALRARPAVLRAETAVATAVVGVIALLTTVPLGYLLWKTFLPEGEFSLARFSEAYRANGLTPMLANSLSFAAGSTALAVCLGTLLAFLIVRTDLPARRLMFAAALAPLALPGVLYAIAWIFLASPRSGVLNVLFGEGTFDIFSLGGMVFVEGLHLSPLAFLLMAAAFRSMDPSFEESALVSGARGLSTVRRVTIPLLRPALAAAVLILTVRTLGAFTVPALLGLPGGIWVFTSRIWRALGEYPPDVGSAAAYSTSLLVLSAVGVFVHGRLWRHGMRYQTVTGRGFRPTRVPLGRWRWAAAGFVGCYAFVAAVLPLLVLLHVSTQRFYSAPTRESLGQMTFEPYLNVLGDEQNVRALKNSFLLGVGAATGVMVLAAVASWLVLRTRLRGRRLIDGLAFLPIAVPGLVLGVALLFVYLRSPLPVYGTLWIILIAYLTLFLPYGMRYASVAMVQVGRELEESAQTSGAAWWHTLRRVLIPLMLPGLAAGWLYILIVAMRELSTSILLYSPGSEVLSVTIWEHYSDGRFPEVAALGVLMVAGLAVLTVLAYRVGGRRGLLDA